MKDKDVFFFPVAEPNRNIQQRDILRYFYHPGET